MVMPSWDNFSSPNAEEEEYKENEIAQEIPGGIQEEEKPEAEKPQWGNFDSPETYQGQPDPTEEENIFGYTVRNMVGSASALAEQYFGRYGNLEKMGKDIISNYPKSMGVVGWALSELLGPERWERMIRGPEGRQQSLPTSNDLRDISETISNNYTKPKTKGENKFRNVIEDVGSTISGRTFNNPTVRNIGLNNLLTPVASNAVKETVDYLGFGDDKANLAKAAVWIPISLASNVNARSYAADLMNRGRNGFSNQLNANVPRYQSRMNIVARNMLQGDPRSQLAQQQLAGINNDIANGQTSIRDLMTRYDAINAAKRDRGLFALNPGDRKAAIRNINQVRDALRGEIEILGQANPQALNDWQNGVNAFATIHRSNAITNWVESIAKGPYAKIISGPAAALFGVTSYGGIKNPLIAGPASALASTSYKTGQTLYRMWNDPNLSNYYWKAISDAQAENIVPFINNYNKLNEKLKKSDSIEKKSKSKK